MATRKTNPTPAKKTTRPVSKTSTTQLSKNKSLHTEEASPSPRSAQTQSAPVLARRFKVKRSTLIAAILIIAVIGLLVYFRNLFVVATVNGQPISRLNYISETESVYVPDARVTAGKQALNQIVTKTLLNQEANRRHITISDKEIDDSIKDTRKNLEKSGQTLEAALSLQGDSLTAYKERIKIQKILDKLVGTINVTDKEIADYIEKNKASLPENLSEADAKSQVKDSLKQQKYNEKVQALIQGLQQKAKITYYIPQ